MKLGTVAAILGGIYAGVVFIPALTTVDTEDTKKADFVIQTFEKKNSDTQEGSVSESNLTSVSESNSAVLGKGVYVQGRGYIQPNKTILASENAQEAAKNNIQSSIAQTKELSQQISKIRTKLDKPDTSKYLAAKAKYESQVLMMNMNLERQLKLQSDKLEASRSVEPLVVKIVDNATNSVVAMKHTMIGDDAYIKSEYGKWGTGQSAHSKPSKERQLEKPTISTWTSGENEKIVKLSISDTYYINKNTREETLIRVSIESHILNKSDLVPTPEFATSSLLRIPDSPKGDGEKSYTSTRIDQKYTVIVERG